MANVITLEFLESEIPGSAKFKVDDIEYIYEVIYNERCDFYVLVITDEETESELFRRKLSIGSDLLRYSKRGTVEGEKINVEIDRSLFCFDDNGVSTQITKDNFYTDIENSVKVRYV